MPATMHPGLQVPVASVWACNNIIIQLEKMMKVDAERQQAEAKVKEDIESMMSTNDKTIADLKAEVEDAITKTGIILKEEQNKDNSALI